MVNTVDGVTQLEYVNPFKHVEAETMNAQKGIQTGVSSKGGMYVTDIGNGDWIKVRGVDFDTSGAAAFTASIASEMKAGYSKTGAIEVRIDDVDGPLIGTLPVLYSGGTDVWKQATTDIKLVTGVHDLYLVFKSKAGIDVFNLDYWYFTSRTNSKDLLAIAFSLDDCKIDTVKGYNSTSIEVKAIYSDGTNEVVTSKASFSFDKEKIISVTNGRVTGESYGSVTAIVRYKGKSDSAKIIVKDLQSEYKVSRLLIDDKNINLFLGGSLAFKLLAGYEDGYTEDVTHKASYEIPTPEIVTLSSGFVTAIGEGEANIKASYMGKLGDTLSTIIHVTVKPRGGVWIEAECGNVGSLWEVISGEMASNNKFVAIRSGLSSTGVAPTDTAGLLIYNFNLEAGGTFKLFARVICPNSNEDSFWLKMDDGRFSSWNNIATSTTWKWAGYSDTFDLKAGDHTLIIGYREDGAKLDKLWISTDLDAELTDEDEISGYCKRKK
jgi:hypothetical protein